MKFILKRLFNENIDLSLRAFRANIQNNIEYLNNKYQNDNDNIDLNQSGFNNQLNLKFKNSKFKYFLIIFILKKRE